MKEITRLQYLDALGVEQWVANSSLANARASEFVSFECQDETSSQGKDFQEPVKTIQEVSSQQNIVSEPQVDDQSQQLEIKHSSEKIISDKPVSYHLQFQGKQGAYVCLAELPVQASTLNMEEQKLLENIMKAIDKLQDLEKKPTMRAEVFKWPMFRGQGVVSHIDHSESAAKEALNAFLFSFLKRNRQDTLIVFGRNVLNLLDLDACDKNSIKTIKAPSLKELSSNVDNKKLLWLEIKQKLG